MRATSACRSVYGLQLIEANLKAIFIPIFLLLTAQQASAMSTLELITNAIENGHAEGVITGKASENLQAKTHSTDPTYAVMERLSEAEAGCYRVRLTLRQPNVPLRNGGNAGDYVTVTKLDVCKGGLAPVNPKAPELVDCTVGKTSCMPKPAVGGLGLRRP